MNNVFAPASTDPDIKAIEAERESLMKEKQYLRDELEKMHDEYMHLRSDNDALKELCIKLAMHLMGVNNGS